MGGYLLLMEYIMKIFINTIVAVAAMFFGSVAFAQDTAGDEVKKPEHVLVSVPRHRTQAETALPITVLSGDELRKRITSTIGETLNNKPGLASASFGPGVGQPVIRGQQGPRVTVLQNSMTSADASTVSADHSVSVEPVLAKSIEVLRGPATLLYGGGAIGGVVNVIDQRVPVAVPDGITGAAEVRHASVNDETVSVITLDGGVGSFAFHFDAMNRDSNNVDIPGLAAQGEEGESLADLLEETTDGFIGNSDSRTDSFTLGGSYILEKGYIGFAINRLENEYGIPGGAHGDEEGEEEEEEEENVRLDIEQTRYDIRGDIHDVSKGIEKIRWFLTYTDYEHDELEGPEVGTAWERETIESRFELLHNEWNGWHGVIGLQIQDSELEAVGDESFLPRSETSQYGLFIVEDFHHNDWIYELGLRLDSSEVDPDSSVGTDAESFTAISFSASALWQANDQWSFGVALSQSERAPVTEELFSNDGNAFGDFVEHVATGAIEVGATDLDVEQANNLDITVNYQDSRLDGYVTFFYNDFSDYITLGNSGIEQDGTLIFNYIQDDAVFQGVEFELTIQLAAVSGGELSLDIFGDWLDAELDNNGDVPRLPPQRLGSRLNYQHGALSTYISVVEADDQDSPGLNEEETDGYTRWDAGIDYTIDLSDKSQLLTFLRVKNIDDEEIRNSSSFLREISPEPGRSIEAGLRFTF